MAFSPASATYNVRPLGLTVSPTGVEPLAAPCTRDTSMVAISRSVRVLITETVSLFAFAV